MEEYVHISSAEYIQDSVARNVEGFSFANTAGSLVNNQKFSEGFVDFQNGKNSDKAYVWRALSAISDKLGEAMFENVRDYIDNVSNVDVCKTRALRSMMKLIDVNYQIIDKVEYYPIEVQKLIDILSINKKNLLNNQFMKEDFMNMMVESGVLSCISANIAVDPAALSIDGAVSSSINQFVMMSSEQAFDSYLKNLYADFLSDMIEMRGTGLCSEQMIYKTLSPYEYGPETSCYEDKYLSAKNYNNIDINFNVEQIVDDIEMGQCNLSDFSGAKLSLLVKEMKYRESPATDLSTFDLATRNIYYRKKKVIEYAEFVDNMAQPLSNFTMLETYGYDSDYFTLAQNSGARNYCISAVGTPDVCIVSADVHKAAAQLAQMTKYISKIREMVKLQARKVFMKGTDNLLQYVANEFLIDYISYVKNNLCAEYVDPIFSKLSAHSANDIKVQEYWDQTEYMNISSQTTQYSANPHLANPRYFDSTFTRQSNLLVPVENNVFTNEQINNFYLDDLKLKTTLDPVIQSPNASKGSLLSSNFYEFLSVLFDIAANNSYYGSDGHFGAKLHLSNDVITEQIDYDLNLIKQIQAFISGLAVSANFTFDGSEAISTQMFDFNNAIERALSSYYLAEVSSVHDKYYPTLNAISSDFASTKNDLSIALNKTYSSYFCKSDSKYSYYSDGGAYKFDYYIGNPAYAIDTYYIQQLTSAWDWIKSNDHCTTYPLSVALQNISAEYDKTSTSIQDVASQLSPYNFIDMHTEDLEAEMDSIKQFANQKISERKSSLVNALANIRQQASSLKTAYDNIANQFTAACSRLPQFLGSTAFKYVGQDNGEYRPTNNNNSSTTTNADVIYDPYSQTYFTDAKTGKKTHRKASIANWEADDTKTLEANIDAAANYVKQFNGIYWGSGANGAQACSSSEATIKTLSTNLTALRKSFDVIKDQVKQLFGDDAAKKIDSLVNTNDVLASINSITSYVNKDLSEQQFDNDKVMVFYNDKVLKQISEISGDYLPIVSEYQSLYTLFADFLMDFPKNSNYRTLMPYNLSSLSDYRQRKDNKALAEIDQWFTSAQQQYDALVQRFVDVCNEDILLYDTMTHQKVYLYSGDVLENCLSSLHSRLLEDIDFRQAIGNQHIEDHILSAQYNIECVSDSRMPEVDSAGLYLKYFPNALKDQLSGVKHTDADFGVKYKDAFYAQVTSFMDIVQQIVDVLDYTGLEEYAQSKMLFQNYGGISVSTDPYYNSKNQTHPSYQVHPFLWNFIEKTNINKVIDDIASIVYKIDIEEISKKMNANAISSLIGEFGETVDLWRHQVNDFTGYTTRYEQSNHVSKHTKLPSEVVDYDGLFYPPALEKYLEEPSYDSIEEYYSHLNMHGTEQEQKISSLLVECENDIRRVAKFDDPTKAYEISKYYLDSSENIYVLCKCYGGEELTEHQKLIHPGELWIRLVDTPIAFPISSVVSDETYSNLSNLNICDVQMFGGGSKIVITYRDKTSDEGEPDQWGAMHSMPLYIKYNLPIDSGVGDLVISDYDPERSGIDQTHEFPSQKDVLPDDLTYGYIGSYSRNNMAVDVLYARTSCDEDGNIKIQEPPKLSVYTCALDKVMPDVHTADFVDIHKIAGDVPVASIHRSNDGVNYLDVAFAVNRDNYIQQTDTQLSIDMLSDSYGAVFADPIAKEMNSLDTLEQDIVVKRICLSNIDAKPTTYQHQLNSDMGYSPLYTKNYYGNVLDISHEIEESHQPIELLGKSKNIDKLIDNARLSTDPYITKEAIIDKYMYGRIYEHGSKDISLSAFLDENDKSLRIFDNKSFYMNMPDQYENGQHYGYYSGNFIWDIRLDNKYSEKDMQRLKVYVYNVNTLGRNPYVAEDLSSIAKRSEHLKDAEFLDANYDVHSKYDVSGVKFNIDNEDVFVCGTQNGVDQVDINFSNKIENISNVKYKLVTLQNVKYLQFAFEVENEHAKGFIDTNEIKVILVNEFDLRFFEWYHLLDPGATFEDIVMELNRVHGNPILKEQLLALDLSQYDYLSDVQISGLAIFQTNRRLSFKYSEEDIFELSSNNPSFYIPTLNTTYPMNAAQAFKTMFIDANVDNYNNVIEMFNTDEVYQLDVQDAEILSAIGLVGIDVNTADAIDDVRVYEDYYDLDEDGTPNSQKYPLDDPMFYQYAHFSCTDLLSSIISIEVPKRDYINVRVEEDDNFSRFVSNSGLSALHSEDSQHDVAIDNSFDCSDIDAEQLEEAIDKIKSMLRVYMNYKKSQNGIVLYANYQNFVNSPFLCIRDGKTYIDKVPGTYAEIMPGENAELDIVLQFRRYNNKQLIGFQNVVVTTVQIYNLSDDKPKFLMKKLNAVQKDQYQMPFDDQHPMKIYENDIMVDSYTTFDYRIRLMYDGFLPDQISCIIRYPTYALQNYTEDKHVSKIQDGQLMCVFDQYNRSVCLKFYPNPNANGSYTIQIQNQSNYNLHIVNGRIRLNTPSVQKYRATFIANGGKFEDGSVQKNIIEYAGIPFDSPSVSRDMHTFIGWDPSDVPAVMPNYNSTYVAQWKQKQHYKLEFNLNGGASEDLTAYSIIEDQLLDATYIPNVYKEGFWPNGWQPELPDKMPSQNLTLTAQWRVKQQYTLSFDLNGGSWSSSDQHEMSVYEDAQLKSLLPTKNDVSNDGYEFISWTPIVDRMPSKDLTLTAQWERLYTLTLDFNNNTDNYVSSIAAGTRIKYLEMSYIDHTVEGYAFYRWSEEFPEFMPAEDLTLIAQWEPVLSNVNYELATIDAANVVYDNDSYRYMSYDKNNLSTATLSTKFNDVFNESNLGQQLWKTNYLTSDQGTNIGFAGCGGIRLFEIKAPDLSTLYTKVKLSPFIATCTYNTTVDQNESIAGVKCQKYWEVYIPGNSSDDMYCASMPTSSDIKYLPEGGEIDEEFIKNGDHQYLTYGRLISACMEIDNNGASQFFDIVQYIPESSYSYDDVGWHDQRYDGTNYNVKPIVLEFDFKDKIVNGNVSPHAYTKSIKFKQIPVNSKYWDDALEDKVKAPVIVNAVAVYENTPDQ